MQKMVQLCDVDSGIILFFIAELKENSRDHLCNLIQKSSSQDYYTVI